MSKLGELERAFLQLAPCGDCSCKVEDRCGMQDRYLNAAGKLIAVVKAAKGLVNHFNEGYCNYPGHCPDPSHVILEDALEALEQDEPT